ncbi:hypothetical protein BDZ90DRAFT_233761 [Jaminaea rosea]|uniref:Maltose/galactoside acetyltransferase domain-containing protein n=1 Tax=Jaminaea rosea TaxID=1569628 RepID=A0A316ULD9_9BASI|nr:hypothetical protein BDZ90DRAFT_233761 [Jaminaea rosea]PWN25754.1 hypothetical protein BDZ90DRAFT_233761 [Jaminaea rosea]
MSNNAARFAAVDASHGHLLSTLSETEKSLLGLPYAANEPALVRARLRARRLFLRYNQTGPSTHDPADLPSGQKPQGIGGSDDDGAEVAPGVNSEERRHLLAELFGISFEQTAQVEVEPPFYCDYGTNIKLEGSWYTNFNTVILDCSEVSIGTGVLFGPK